MRKELTVVILMLILVLTWKLMELVKTTAAAAVALQWLKEKVQAPLEHQVKNLPFLYMCKLVPSLIKQYVLLVLNFFAKKKLNKSFEFDCGQQIPGVCIALSRVSRQTSKR